MSEGQKNRSTGVMFLVLGALFVGVAFTDVPGAQLGFVLGAVLLLIGVALVVGRRGVGP